MKIGDQVTKIMNNAGKWFKKYSPEILTGCGIAGFCGSIVLTAKNAPKAKERLDILHEDLANSGDDLSRSEIIWAEVKTVVPYYIPTVATAAVSSACVLGAHKIQTRRTAALATAYELSQTAFNEYQEKVKEKLGEKKEGEVRNSIMEDHIKENPPSKDLVKEELDAHKENEVFLTDGKVLWFDAIGGRYFRASQQEVERAVKYISDRLPLEMWMSLNELYFELGIPQTIAGDQLGFTAERGIDLVDYNCVEAPNGVSASVMDFLARPIPEYRSF